MKELYNDMDDKSRDAARNIRIAFDNNAWDKMEAMLNEEQTKPLTPVTSNKLILAGAGDNDRRWSESFLIFFLSVALVLFIKNDMPEKSKILPITNGDKKISNTKNRVINQQNTQDKAVQLINEYKGHPQPEEINAGNKNFNPKATIDKKQRCLLQQTELRKRMTTPALKKRR